MRKKRIAAAALSVAIFVPATAAQSRTLADIYKTGRVKLVEEVRVADAALPEDAVFRNPRCLAFDAKGRIYVADYDAHHLKVFGPDGKFIKTIGRKGQGPGEFQAPAYVEIGGGRIFVWEAMNRRISILDAEGKFLLSTPYYPGVFGLLIRMRALPDGRLVAYYERGMAEGTASRVPDSQQRVVELLSTEAKPLRVLYEKKVRASQLAWIADYRTYVRVPFPYHPAVAMDVLPAGAIAAGLNEKYEFEILDPDKGRQETFSRPWTPIKVADKDKQDHFAEFKMTVIQGNVKKTLPKAPDYILKNTEFPEAFPPYRSLIADGEGNIWAQVFTEDRASNVFDVFDPRTGFLAKIIVDGATLDRDFAGVPTNRFAGTALWRIERDADEYCSLVKYRLTAAK